MGVATPFELWNWAQFIGAPEAEMDAWRDFDMEAELTKASGCDVLIQNDATAACGAELVFGNDAPRDFLHIYLGFFVGGGIVLNGSLFTGRHGSSGAIGPMPVPTNAGGSQQLLEIASIATLEKRIIEAGGDGMALWKRPVPHWLMPLSLRPAFWTLRPA
jgi:predicted NBD/HSP70 family sugar kinase